MQEGRGEFQPNLSLNDLAHQFAVRVMGPKPTRGSDREYWDQYYNLVDDYILSHTQPDFDDAVACASEPFEDDPLFDEIGEPSQQEVLDALDTLTTMLGSIRGETNSKNAFFTTKESRNDVFEFSKKIAEYLQSNKIKSLVIVDRSSRPLYIGVMEYWRKMFPNEKIPSIYFVNPKGFKNQAYITPSEAAEISLDSIINGESLESISNVRTKNEVVKEFRSVYPELMKNKNEPAVIFDTCIHSGDTLESVVKIFKELKFTNVKIGSVNPSGPDSKIKTDFYLTTKKPEQGCYPFDRDRLIEKTFEHVYSQPSNEPSKKALAFALRREIKKIMQEKLK